MSGDLLASTEYMTSTGTGKMTSWSFAGDLPHASFSIGAISWDNDIFLTGRFLYIYFTFYA